MTWSFRANSNFQRTVAYAVIWGEWDLGELETWLAGRETISWLMETSPGASPYSVLSKSAEPLMSMEARVGYSGQDVEKELTMKRLDLGASLVVQ